MPYPSVYHNMIMLIGVVAAVISSLRETEASAMHGVVVRRASVRAAAVLSSPLRPGRPAHHGWELKQHGNGWQRACELKVGRPSSGFKMRN